MPAASAAAWLAALALAAPAFAAPSSEPARLPARVTIDETDPKRAAFLRDAFAALQESPTARELEKQFDADGPSVTVRFAPLDSSALQFEGAKPVISGLSAFTQYGSTGDVVSINERLLTAATPRQVAQDLAHEILGHCYERALADRAGVGYVYAVTRDNETAASLLGWLAASELGQKQRDESPFSYLADAKAYFEERLYMGADYAAGLEKADLARAREVYARRVELVKKRAQDWEGERKLDDRQLSWIDHFVDEHGWPREPFDLLSAELTHMRDEEAPRSARLCERVAETIGGLEQALAGSAADRRLLAKSARHPLLKRWATQVRERTDALRTRLAKTGQTEPELQKRPEGEITQDELLKMIDADMKFHEGAGAPLPAALK